MLQKVEVYGFPVNPLVLPIESESSPFQIKNIDGLGPVKAAINTTPLNQDELLTGTTLGKRNIVLTMGLNPDWTINQSYDSLRQGLYQYFMPQLKVRLRFYSTNLPVVDIEGVVEGCEPNIWVADPEYQISIICPKPDFVSITQKSISNVTRPWGDYGVPTPITYDGTAPAGVFLTITPTVLRPSYDGDYSFTIGDDRPSIQFAGPVDSARQIEMDTTRGQRKVQVHTPTSGLIRSLLASVPNKTTWPFLRIGNNNVYVWSRQAGLKWKMDYYERFGGI